MSAKIRSGGRFSIPGKDGAAADGWKIETFTAGSAGVLGTDDKETFTDYTLGTAHANPIILDERGEKEIWWDGTYLIRVRDAAGNQIYTMDYFGAGDDPIVDVNAAPLNGSFEVDDNGDAIPNNWTLSIETGGTIEKDDTDADHGQSCLNFTGTTNGAGTAESDKFSVQPGETRELTFTYKSSAATTLNSVDVKWYNHAGTNISTSSLYSNGTTNPSVFTEKYAGVVVPATAVEATILLTGINSGGTTVAGTTKFDNVGFEKVGNSVVQVEHVSDGLNRFNFKQGATGVKPELQVSGEANTGFVIKDSNGNEVLIAESVSSAVNEVKATNSITAVNPKIGASGEANTGLIIEDSNSNGIIIAESVANAVNELTITNAITTEDPSIKPTGTDTNINVEIDGKGTGRLTTKGTPVYGKVNLSTPELLLDNTSPASTPTAFNSTTLNTADAKIAILKLYSQTNTGGSMNSYFSDATFTPGIDNQVLLIGGIQIDIAIFEVGLDGNNDFWYSNTYGGTVNNYKLYLLGYYV